MTQLGHRLVVVLVIAAGIVGPATAQKLPQVSESIVFEPNIEFFAKHLRREPAADPRVQRDLPYTEPRNERQTLDVYAPAEGKNHPVIVWIHGGGWHSGDKKDVKQKPQAFTDKGFVFVSINYRLQMWTDPQLSPGVTIKEIAKDVARAIRWTHDHAGDYGGDTNTIFVMGHSAGAQLAALVCTDDRYLKAEKLSLAIIKGCAPVDGDTFDLPMRIATVHQKGDKKLADRD